MARKKLFAGNWKMHKSLLDARAFFSGLEAEKKSQSRLSAIGLVILPQAPILTLASEFPSLVLGAQNTHWEERGAFTGELSAVLAKELGAKYALAGHSERRQFFAETSETAVQRAIFADRCGLKPILCIGETLQEREAGFTEQVLQRQLEPLFKAEPAGMPGMVLAYEPVWAIGTGRNATSEQVEAVHAFLRLEIANHWGGDNAESLQVLYGGSVKEDNARDLIRCANVDGFLVGGASLQLASFLAIAASGLE